MPKVVDRTEKREEVLEATWRLMARVGIDRVSIREIAAEAGCSTGVIAHYFKNKEDVLQVVRDHPGHRCRQRIAAWITGRRNRRGGGEASDRHRLWVGSAFCRGYGPIEGRLISMDAAAGNEFERCGRICSSWH